MRDPISTSDTVNCGESWPVAVALSLRENSFISANFRSTTALRQAILSLPDGTLADHLIILYSGVGGDGARRDFASVRQALVNMSMSNVTTRFMPGGGRTPWSDPVDDPLQPKPAIISHAAPVVGICQK